MRFHKGAKTKWQELPYTFKVSWASWINQSSNSGLLKWGCIVSSGWKSNRITSFPQI